MKRQNSKLLPSTLEFPRERLSLAAGKRRFKAVVLTYDRNRFATSHMRHLYRSVWRGQSFSFHIPFQSLRGDDGDDAIFIPSPAAIRATALRLLEDFADEDWLYWCIDDKYPVWMDTTRISRLFDAVVQGGAETIDGITFCRNASDIKPERDGQIIEVAGEPMVERADYTGIWIHQLLRAKVLRHMFQSFPETIARAKDMDGLKDQLSKPRNHRLLATSTNLALFGESTRRGIITRNCLNSCRRAGIEIPQEVLQKGVCGTRFVGTLIPPPTLIWSWLRRLGSS